MLIFRRVGELRLTFITVIFMTALFWSFNLKAEASEFTHIHKESCYGTVYETCTNHQLRAESGTALYNCPVCNSNQEFDQTIWWDICLDNHAADMDVAYVEKCKKCGYVRCDQAPGEPGGHSYSYATTICNMTESTPIAQVVLTQLSSAPTKGPVTLEVLVNKYDGSFALAPEPYDFGNGYQMSSRMDVTENGTYTVSVKDSLGRVASASVTVSNIEKETVTPAPTPVIPPESVPADNSPVNSNPVPSDNAPGNSNPGSTPNDPSSQPSGPALLPATAVPSSNGNPDSKKAVNSQLSAAKKSAKEGLEKEKKTLTDQENADEELGDLSGNDLSGNDVSGNDISGNDLSGNDKENLEKIAIVTISDNDMTYDKTQQDDGSYRVITSLSDLEGYKTKPDMTDFQMLKAGLSKTSLKIGIPILLLGLLFFSCFNYVYISNEGKISLVALCRVKREENKIIVVIPKGKLKKRGRHVIYFSIWNRLKNGNKKLPVYVTVKGEQTLLTTDEGIAFKY